MICTCALKRPFKRERVWKNKRVKVRDNVGCFYTLYPYHPRRHYVPAIRLGGRQCGSNLGACDCDRCQRHYTGHGVFPCLHLRHHSVWASGGAYYLISRALGVKMGGGHWSSAVSFSSGFPHIVLLCAFTVYSDIVARCSRSTLCSIFIILVTASALRATDLVLKSQVGIFVLVGLSVSLSLGGLIGVVQCQLSRAIMLQ